MTAGLEQVLPKTDALANRIEIKLVNFALKRTPLPGRAEGGIANDLARVLQDPSALSLTSRPCATSGCL